MDRPISISRDLLLLIHSSLQALSKATLAVSQLVEQDRLTHSRRGGMYAQSRPISQDPSARGLTPGTGGDPPDEPHLQ